MVGALLLGRLTDPAGGSGATTRGHAVQEHGGTPRERHPAPEQNGVHAGEHPSGVGEPAGLQIAQARYRLVLERDRFAGEEAARVRFRILGRDGEPLRAFEVTHEKRLHLIVVRRDLSGFQHLHPTMDRDGTWTASVDFSRGGAWRLFADFAYGEEQHTLGADIHVAGAYEPTAPLPASETSSSDGGLQVRLRAAPAIAGESQELGFEVRDGRERVNDQLETLLGARGHLVALRAGDLAYLHTHADGDRLAFGTSWPSPGTYRLFLQFHYEGRVHTAMFTQEVAR